MIIDGLIVLSVVVVVAFFIGGGAAILRRFDGSYEPEHQAPRLLARSAAGAARAGRRVLGTTRRLPGAKRRQQLTEFTEELDDYGATNPVPGLNASLRARYGTLGDGGGLTYGVVAVPQMSPAPPGTAAAGGIPPPPPPPELSHDAFRWPQWYHPEPAVARREATLGSLGAVSAVLLIGAITAEAWHAEVRATSPWEHDTSWFTLAAIDADVAAIRDHGDWDAPLSIPAEVIHEMEAGV